jgi:dUTP pyrophosphatase|tara:strand:- start:25975 stop:26439 length:465 start_codon:yes stop_codon:yes gene_type:complete
MIIEYSRVRPDAKPPTRANPSDAGLDLFFNPESIEAGVRIKPGESKLFQTGIRVGVPHGYMLEIKNRSSVAAKRSLLVGACVVDSGYDGEIFVNLHNVGSEEQIVTRHDKIAQAVMVPVVHFRALETGTGDLYNWHPITISNRGDGALGSTDES